MPAALAGLLESAACGAPSPTGDTVWRLAHFFGTSPPFWLNVWLNLQALYELRLADRKVGKAVRSCRLSCGGKRADAWMSTFDEYRVLPLANRLSRLRRTPGELEEAVADRDDAELGRRPGPRNWSAKAPRVVYPRAPRLATLRQIKRDDRRGTCP
jgi:hypothetical protein